MMGKYKSWMRLVELRTGDELTAISNDNGNIAYASEIFLDARTIIVAHSTTRGGRRQRFDMSRITSEYREETIMTPAVLKRIARLTRKSGNLMGLQ